ncbi:MAG: hypothetical protein HY961_20000 [Ignavibacteriae bacterium]|nr:hypothetical protein [Ignavibacteriota bacterium]
MGKLNLDEIQPGMVLAADVIDRNGRVLLKSGLEVNEKHLKILKQWGVTEADITGVDREVITAQATQSLAPEVLAQAEAHCADLFRHHDLQLPVNQELFRLSVLRYVNQHLQGAPSDN